MLQGQITPFVRGSGKEIDQKQDTIQKICATALVGDRKRLNLEQNITNVRVVYILTC